SVPSGDEWPRDELRGAAGGKEIRQHLVVPRLGKGHLDDPRSISLKLRVDVLEVSHVLADHEEVILPLVNGLELEDRFSSARMEDAEVPSGRFEIGRASWRG